MEMMIGLIIKNGYGAYYQNVDQCDALSFYQGYIKKMTIPESDNVCPLGMDDMGIVTIDEDGLPALPAESFLRDHFYKRASPKGDGKSKDKTYVLGDRNLGMYIAACRGSMFISKIFRHMVECDLAPSQVARVLSDIRTTRNPSKDERVMAMAINRNFVRRLIYGAYNRGEDKAEEMTHAFFRNDIENQGKQRRFIHINPLDLFCAARIRQRHFSLLVTMVPQGLMIPDYLHEVWEKSLREHDKLPEGNKKRAQMLSMLTPEMIENMPTAAMLAEENPLKEQKASGSSESSKKQRTE